MVLSLKRYRKSLSKRSTAQVEATAYHEAGHAVIAYVLGYRPQCVTIVPTVDTAGHIIHTNPLHGFQLNPDTSDEARLRIESLITICFAGQSHKSVKSAIMAASARRMGLRENCRIGFAGLWLCRTSQCFYSMARDCCL